MSLPALENAAKTEALEVVGYCRTKTSDKLKPGTLALLGPSGPDFWRHFTSSSEFIDGAEDPLDRWSHRVVSNLAAQFGGLPLFPFGEPARPFIGWALRSGRAWSSPVGLLVHDTAGLMVSYRGAIFFEKHIDLPTEPVSPCESCSEKPCQTSCPVKALSQNGYDTQSCHSFLDTSDGQSCMSNGCAVRLACPISQTYARKNAQSAFHMMAFHKST